MKFVNGDNKFFDITKYEAKQQKFVKDYLKPNYIVLELGARWGIISCIINNILKKNNILCI